MESTRMASTPNPSTPTPTPTPPARARFNRRWLWIAPAFLVGLVLFFLAIRPHKHGDFFHAGEDATSTDEPEYAPLPAPMAGGDSAVIGTPEAPTPSGQAPVAQQQQQPVAPPAPVAHTAPAQAPRAPAIADRKPRPIPGQTPPPEYPRRALREGDSGTALVVVRIGPDGVPLSAEIAQSSGSRDLDRAATEGVRRWRFEPAIADGHPTVGEVVVPIDFTLSQ